MDQVDNIAQAINEMPTAGMIPVVLALITGLLLWAAGRRILLAAFAVIGLVVGVTAGWMVGELIGLVGMEIWIPTLVGGVIFACVAALASRLVIALALALTLGIAAWDAAGRIGSKFQHSCRHSIWWISTLAELRLDACKQFWSV